MSGADSQREIFMLTTSITVTQATAHIRDLFDRDDVLQDVWVSGEVSNMRPASSGHWYFTLKDSNAQLRCVMWRSSAERQRVTPRDGDALEVHGKVSVYEPRGEYQLYADAIRPVGVGDLYQQFERLKAKLEAEGLFEAERKRGIPYFPHQIGVVTSPTAAAFQDILNVLARRFPLAEVILSPTMVQGDEAAPQIVRAIERLNEHTSVDVILLCRGGGSIEDLWPFNEERVARAVATSRIPVITGVGHETDFTIVDFVSDERAPTPSAAAALVTPDITEMGERLYRLDERLIGMMYDKLLALQNDLDGLQRTLKHVSPETAIRTNRQRIDDLNSRIHRQQRAFIGLLRERLQGKRSALLAASPDAILARGYAIVTRSEDGRRIVSELDARPGMGISVRLRDGEIKARVEDKDTHEQYKRTLF
jgi:exodeoxyribonuclease VII large subunit